MGSHQHRAACLPTFTPVAESGCLCRKPAAACPQRALRIISGTSFPGRIRPSVIHSWSVPCSRGAAAGSYRWSTRLCWRSTASWVRGGSSVNSGSSRPALREDDGKSPLDFIGGYVMKTKGGLLLALRLENTTRAWSSSTF